MAGTTRRNDEAERLKWVAAWARVTERAARNWRHANDPRWVTGCVEYHKAHGGKSPGHADPDDEAEITDDGLGDGLESEIERCRRECRVLAHRAGQLEKLKNHTEALTVHRILDAKRETLLRLERDAVGIAVANGEVVAKVCLTNYIADVVAALSPFAHRIATIVPPEIAAEIRERVQVEVAQLQTTCQTIQLRTE